MLRAPDTADWPNWHRVREESRAFLTPWEPQWGTYALTHVAYAHYVRKCWREWRQDKAYAFMMFAHDRGDTPVLIGGVSLLDVVRGTANSVTLGYWMGKDYAQQGYMTEGAALVCDFAFHTLGFDRIEATCMPRNEPSMKVLRRLGFTETGFALNYLQINGRMEDHLLWRKEKPER